MLRAYRNKPKYTVRHRDKTWRQVRDEFDWYELIGSGHTSDVYSVGIDGDVYAAKVYKAQFAEARFDNEFDALWATSHLGCTPAIAEVGDDYILIEFIDGMELRDIHNEMSIQQKLDVYWAIAKSVDAIHDAGVWHGDLHLGNIMVTADGIVLVDFGVASIGEEDLDDSDWVMQMARALEHKDAIDGDILFDMEYADSPEHAIDIFVKRVRPYTSTNYSYCP